MMRLQKKKYIVVLTILIVTTLFMSGCTKKQTNTQQLNAGLETCAELNGYICNDSQDCNGSWLDASDTFRCCSCECTINPSENATLSTDLFEETPQDEGFGDIQ